MDRKDKSKTRRLQLWLPPSQRHEQLLQERREMMEVQCKTEADGEEVTLAVNRRKVRVEGVVHGLHDCITHAVPFPN